MRRTASGDLLNFCAELHSLDCTKTTFFAFHRKAWNGTTSSPWAIYHHWCDLLTSPSFPFNRNGSILTDGLLSLNEVFILGFKRPKHVCIGAFQMVMWLLKIQRSQHSWYLSDWMTTCDCSNKVELYLNQFNLILEANDNQTVVYPNGFSIVWGKWGLKGAKNVMWKQFELSLHFE